MLVKGCEIGLLQALFRPTSDYTSHIRLRSHGCYKRVIIKTYCIIQFNFNFIHLAHSIFFNNSTLDTSGETSHKTDSNAASIEFKFGIAATRRCSLQEHDLKFVFGIVDEGF